MFFNLRNLVFPQKYPLHKLSLYIKKKNFITFLRIYLHLIDKICMFVEN